MKVLEGAFNQEKVLVGAFSVVVKTGCGTDGALHSTTTDSMSGALLCLGAQVITPGIYDSGAGVWNHVRVYRKN